MTCFRKVMSMKVEGLELDALMDGWLEGGSHVYPLVVQYEDTDAAGIVYHANYISYAERARTALLRCMGVDMNALITRGDIIVISRIEIDYRNPSVIGDRLYVRTNRFRLGRTTLNMLQVIGDRDGKIRASLQVRGAFVSASGGRPVRVPQDVRAKMEKFTSGNE